MNPKDRAVKPYPPLLAGVVKMREDVWLIPVAHMNVHMLDSRLEKWSEVSGAKIYVLIKHNGKNNWLDNNPGDTKTC